MRVTPSRHGGIWATKPAEELIADTQAEGRRLRRSVGALDLTALGLGAIIGTGIFVVIGEAIDDSGPSIVLAFALAGATCAFSALAFAELASTIPVAGSAYTYSYATMGELVAWVIGWDLLLEYGLAVAGVSVGWGQYLNELLDAALGWSLPAAIANPPGEAGGIVNVPAVFIVLAIAAVLIAGVRESARTNTVMVATKLVVLAVFIGVGLTAFDAGNFRPFFPQGFGGAVTAASVIFFAYIGFDAVSTSGEEARRPSRDLPLAIVGSLLVATILYMAVAVVATGALPYTQLAGKPAPLATVIDVGAGYSWGVSLISLGALVAITSVVLTILYGNTRIMFAMARDGLLPRFFAAVSARTGTPVHVTGTLALLIALLAAFVPLGGIVELVNIGTLSAFLLVNVGVIVLRRQRPDLERGFRVPLVPFFPLVGAGLCVYLMTRLPLVTWLRFLVWLAIGLAVYAAYGRFHSRLRTGPVAPSAGR
jgi:basic amino acid/polyamine antiporter, APA family